jgi:SAM-dependent methyltransferase
MSEALDQVWQRMSRCWKAMGPPLRPAPEDILRYQEVVDQCAAGRPRLSALVLGATPEFASLRWPADAKLTAVDRSEAMLKHVWPLPTGKVGDWLALPLEDESQDLVLGDGVFTLLPFPDGYEALLGSIHRVLKPGGFCALRIFQQPARRETTREVLADLRGGRIGSFHALKWRIAMALHESTRQGVAVKDIWRFFHDTLNPQELARATGWPAEAIATIDSYRDQDARYTFPALAELRGLARALLPEVDCFVSAYELGERCPIVTLYRQAAQARAVQRRAA